MSGRRGRRLRIASFWAAAGLALLVAHDAIALIQVGPGVGAARMLRTAGHGYWPAASTVLVLLAAVAAAWWVARLVRLHGQARRAGAPEGPDRPDTGWCRRALRLWPRMLAVVALAFVVQENVEHLVTHGHLIGLEALIGPEYPLALPVLAAITAAAAALTALVRDREARLILRITVARERLARPARRLVAALRPDRGRRIRRDPLALLRSGRAPPARLLPSGT